MLAEAILSIDTAARTARAEQERRRAQRAALTQAEDFAAAIEEMLLTDVRILPAGLAAEIRCFVAAHERGLVRRLGDAVATLDVLFDLQERLQARRDGAVLGAVDRVA